VNTLLLTGTVIVTLALVCYSIGVLSEQRHRCVTRRALIFLTIGILLDVSATVFMILGSRNTPLTLHGILGYSALSLMLIDTLLVWRVWRRGGANAAVPAVLHLYTRIAFCYWVFVFVAGGFLAAARL